MKKSDKIITDLHTHTTFSADGKDSLLDMATCAKNLGVKYYGVSDHFDFDYKIQNLPMGDKVLTLIDERAYFSAARKLQSQSESESFHLLVGGEFGFAPLNECCELYQRVIEKYNPDYVINSIHTVDGEDCYFYPYFEKKGREIAFRKYLEAILKSVDAPYSYDIIAHIGYVSRKAPYADRKLRYGEFNSLIDEILQGIIQKDKILEVNSSTRGLEQAFLPDRDILERYYFLGGRKISFGSDAHFTSRIAEKRDVVINAAKNIGFNGFTVPIRGRHVLVPFED